MAGGKSIRCNSSVSFLWQSEFKNSSRAVRLYTVEVIPQLHFASIAEFAFDCIYPGKNDVFEPFSFSIYDLCGYYYFSI